MYYFCNSDTKSSWCHKVFCNNEMLLKSLQPVQGRELVLWLPWSASECGTTFSTQLTNIHWPWFSSLPASPPVHQADVLILTFAYSANTCWQKDTSLAFQTSRHVNQKGKRRQIPPLSSTFIKLRCSLSPCRKEMCAFTLFPFLLFFFFFSIFYFFFVF